MLYTAIFFNLKNIVHSVIYIVLFVTFLIHHKRQKQYSVKKIMKVILSTIFPI